MGHAGSVSRQFRAVVPNGAAHHVPDYNSVHALRAEDDLSAQAGMNPGPSVMTRASASIRANALDNELVRVRYPLENGGIAAVEAPFQFDDSHSARCKTEGVIVAVASPADSQSSMKPPSCI